VRDIPTELLARRPPFLNSKKSGLLIKRVQTTSGEERDTGVMGEIQAAWARKTKGEGEKMRFQKGRVNEPVERRSWARDRVKAPVSPPGNSVGETRNARRGTSNEQSQELNWHGAVPRRSKKREKVE